MDVSLSESYKNDEKYFILFGHEEPPVLKPVKSAIRKKSFLNALLAIGKEVFLPEGFPDSVHADYIPYQIWDTIQAFASTIMGTLTTHSIMLGVGVGETTATPLAAAITWILKDGTGMVGRIVFAWWNGTDLDGQCKKWRLFADILNDVAMGIELLIPYFSSYSTIVLCTSTAMKSIVGVAGGATRAALTQHQALRNNLADVSAKDGSQETCVNLIASVFGIFILSTFHDGQYLLQLYLFLVAIHLYANYSAVKVLRLHSLNEDRFALIIKKYLINGDVPHPDEVNREESVLLFTKPAREVCGFDIKIGVSLGKLMRCSDASTELKHVSRQFTHKKYILTVNIRKHIIHIMLARDADSSDVLKAYFHACVCGLFICMILKKPVDMLVKTNTSQLSYYLLHIHALAEKLMTRKSFQLTSTDVDDLSSLAFESVSLTDLSVIHEYKTFVNGLTEKGWTFDNNFLPTDAWRFSWNN